MRHDSKTQSYRFMKEIISFEAMPQIVARLEEKLDALTETVTKLITWFTAPPPDKPEEMVTIKEAAKILHLSVSRVRALVQEGRVPCYKPGRNLLFLPSELSRWLSDSQRKGQPSVEEQMAMMTNGMRRTAKGRRFS
ncbi:MULTISPECIES: helix-turn-helix domain-containing protein [Bacteroidales]|uniref:helix-turn-helix domain-containing protein n=1 Tax=Bacteroidales TaxID=171549 RepID=UPI00266ED5C4|nr:MULTISPECIES: helix-turn-helix domain-containing protein [Bacteroidales]